MKKSFIVLILLYAITLVSKAQSLDEFIGVLSKKEGVVYQLVDSATLSSQIPPASIDESGMSFMSKLQEVEVVTIENPENEIQSQLKSVLNSLDKSHYVLLLQVKEEKDNVWIFNKQIDAERSSVYVVVTDEEDLVIVKLNGRFDQSDLEAIVNEQKKDNKHK